MTVKRHGLSIGIEKLDGEFLLSLKVMGKLTHEDYQHITPMLDAALGTVKQPRVKVLVDITELEGWELRAAWDDFKLGLKHRNEFEKIAVIGNRDWQQFSSRIGSWFISGEIEFFTDSGAAFAWLQS